MPRRVLMIEQTGRGGIADYTAELSRALVGAGWQVELATASDHRYRPTPGVRAHPVFHYVRGHSAAARVVRRVGLGAAINGLRFLASLPRLAALARRAELAHTHKWERAPLGLLAVLALRLAGVPVVQTAHNTFERGRPYTRSNRLLARLLACTIVHTEADRARLIEQRERVDGKAANGKRGSGGRMAEGSARIALIPHGEYGGLARSGGSVDRDAARAALGVPADAPLTLLFGHLRTDKGLGDVLAALPRIPELRLLVAGEEQGALAAERSQLQSQALAGRVIVREGFLEMDEVARLFAATDTVVLPYVQASQSGVLLLAYGFRRPVVGYPVGGLRESVRDGETGWLCARADVESLVEALRASVAAGWPECRRRGEAGARLAEEHFSWPAIARRTSELYEEVLASV